MMVLNKQSRVWLVAAGLAALMPTAMTAQRRSAADEAALQAKSHKMLADLAAIDGDRAAAVHELFARWEGVLDPTIYDIRNGLGDIAATTPAWQLYGASFANDFQTMVRILRGTTPAGKYINAGLQLEVDPANLVGDTTNQLVFTPIPPCRVVDTRGVGARTGFMAANTTRSFDLKAEGLTSGQGGFPPCPGLPGFAHLGWAINVTTTAQNGNGWLVIHPFGGVAPQTSAINYSVGQWSIANGLTVQGCYGCADDITVIAAQSGTHVIIDVTGYYSEATANTAVVTRIPGTTTLVGAGTQTTVTGGSCPAGTVLVSGEVAHLGTDVAIGENRIDTATTWAAWMINNSGNNTNVTVYSRCMDAPVVF